MRIETGEDPATGFKITPAGQFMLRDYSHEDPADLTALRGLLEEVLTQHKMLIPGSINRLVNQWHADVCHALGTGGSAPDGDNHTAGPR